MTPNSQLRTPNSPPPKRRRKLSMAQLVHVELGRMGFPAAQHAVLCKQFGGHERARDLKLMEVDNVLAKAEQLAADAGHGLPHPQRLVGEVDVFPVKSRRLAAPQAGRSDQFQHRAVTQPVGRGQHLPDLGRIEVSGLGALNPGARHPRHRVLGDQVVELRVSQHSPQHRVDAPYRAVGQILLSKADQQPVDVRLAELVQ